MAAKRFTPHPPPLLMALSLRFFGGFPKEGGGATLINILKKNT